MDNEDTKENCIHSGDLWQFTLSFKNGKCEVQISIILVYNVNILQSPTNILDDSVYHKFSILAHLYPEQSINCTEIHESNYRYIFLNPVSTQPIQSKHNSCNMVLDIHPKVVFYHETSRKTVIDEPEVDAYEPIRHVPHVYVYWIREGQITGLKAQSVCSRIGGHLPIIARELDITVFTNVMFGTFLTTHPYSSVCQTFTILCAVFIGYNRSQVTMFDANYNDPTPIIIFKLLISSSRLTQVLLTL